MKEPRGAPVVTLLLVYRNLDIRGYTSYIGCYGRVTNDSKGRDAHAENAGYIGVVWAVFLVLSASA